MTALVCLGCRRTFNVPAKPGDVVRCPACLRRCVVERVSLGYDQDWHGQGIGEKARGKTHG